MIVINNKTQSKIDITHTRKFILSLQKTLFMEKWHIEITFCDKALSHKINKEFLLHDYPTDIITFDISDPLSKGCDIYICTEVALENAIEYQVSQENELKRLIIHGLLHLQGYNDLNPNEKEKMFKKQESLLKALELKESFLKILVD